MYDGKQEGIEAYSIEIGAAGANVTIKVDFASIEEIAGKLPEGADDQGNISITMTDGTGVITGTIEPTSENGEHYNLHLQIPANTSGDDRYGLIALNDSYDNIIAGLNIIQGK